MRFKFLYFLVLISFSGFSEHLDNYISNEGYGSLAHHSPYHFKYVHPAVPNLVIETETTNNILKIKFNTGSYLEISNENIVRYSQSTDNKETYKVSEEVLPEWELSSEERLLFDYQNQYYELIQSQYVPEEEHISTKNTFPMSDNFIGFSKSRVSALQAMSGGRCATQQDFLTNSGYGGFSTFDGCVASEKNALYIATLNASMKCGIRPSSISCHKAGQAQAEAAMAYSAKADSCNRAYKSAKDALKNCQDACYACHK